MCTRRRRGARAWVWVRPPVVREDSDSELSSWDSMARPRKAARCA